MRTNSLSKSTKLAMLFLLIVSLGLCEEARAAKPLGIFEHQDDIGAVLHPGSAIYDSKSDVYTVSSGGENMWFTSDDFHFVWKKASGDISVAADIALVGHTGAPHRKAMLMIRQSLDADSPYVDLAQHGVGKTSLQFRDAPGAITHTIASFPYTPRRIELQKRGEFFYFFVSGRDGKLRPAGASTRLRLSEPFYVGLGVCAHDKDAVEKAIFSHVSLMVSAKTKPNVALYSTLETIAIGSSVEPETEPVGIETNFAVRIDNNHGISPNGQLLAISDQSQDGHNSSVYVVPVVGGFPIVV